MVRVSRPQEQVNPLILGSSIVTHAAGQTDDQITAGSPRTASPPPPVDPPSDIPPGGEGGGLKTLQKLIENTFLNTSSAENKLFQGTLRDFEKLIRDKNTAKNVEFSKGVAPYKLTVRGQVPISQSVVFVIDVERIDGKKFSPQETELLQSYSFTMRFRDPNTDTKIKDKTSKEVVLNEEGGRSKNSMSLGFWPYYALGGRINTALNWDFHKGKPNWVYYKSGEADPSKVTNQILIELKVPKR